MKMVIKESMKESMKGANSCAPRSSHLQYIEQKKPGWCLVLLFYGAKGIAAYASYRFAMQSPPYGLHTGV